MKTLRKNDFLEFFTFVEKRAVSSNIILVSGEKKSVFVFKYGRIVAHKSNVQREHLLDQIIHNLDAGVLQAIKSTLAKLLPHDQWAYLYNKNLIEASVYQSLLNNDCMQIILQHYKSEKTLLLKTPKLESGSKHSLDMSPFKIIFEVLRKEAKKPDVYEKYKRIEISVKKQDVFYLYQKSSDQQAIAYDNVKNIYTVDNPKRELIEDLYVLKEHQILELEVISESLLQKDIIVSEKDLLNKNAFEILGLNQSANGALIKKKYMEMVALYHPDKNGHLPEGEKKVVEKIFSQITLAYKKISTVEQRKDYIKELIKINQNNKASEEAQKQVRAETFFLEGLGYIKNKDFQNAYEKFQESNSILPHEKYRIYAAWSQFKLGEETQSRAVVEQARESLKKETLKDMPMLEALFYLASIEKSLGYYKQAKDYLQQVVDRDPYFMNAKVELSLMSKRV